MLTRSLVVKIYLFAIAALLGLGLLSFFASRALMDEGWHQAFREYGLGQAGFLAREVEAALQGEEPSPQRLRELALRTGARIQFVPWSRVRAYPPALRSEAMLSVPTGRRGIRAWRYWVRVERDGKPVGALRVDLGRPLSRRPERPWLGAGVAMVVVGLITVPPLLLWVVFPLRRMEAVAKRLGEGKLEEPVRIDRRDEFGNLERAFESLRVRILHMLHQRDRLLTDISHELRGPLSRMSIALPLVRAGLGEPHPATPYMDQIEKDIGIMDVLIGELLAFSRGRSPQARQNDRLDLGDLARRLTDSRAIVVEQRRQSLGVEARPAVVTGDPRLLERAMGNLLDNAIKYTPEGGSLEVATIAENGEAVFRVRDSGPGIPESELPHVFERFYRPDSARTREAGGSGLGLAIVRAVAESHGGRALLQPGEGGHGTVAELRLPLAAPAPAAVEV